ncbi:MAG: hypothetical protein WKF65_08520 [Gaiellaceae bacterium]
MDKFYRWINDDKPKRHRITFARHVSFAKCPPERVGAILAHELHHVHEWENGGAPALKLGSIVEHVIARRFGTSPPGIVMTQSPTEVDAHAAATRFLRAHYPRSIMEILASDDPAPARATAPPADPDTLLRRTLEFLFPLVATLTAPLPTPPGKTFPAWLEEVAPGSAVIWRELQEGAPTTRD